MKAGTKTGEFEKTFDLREAPGHLLRLANQRSTDIFNELIGRHTGLSRQQLALMIAMEQNPRATQAQLTAIVGSDRNTLAEMITRLLTKGLIKREPAPTDARAREILLTPKGRELVLSIISAAHEVQGQILAPLDKAHRTIFLECLKRLAFAREDAVASSGGPKRSLQSSSRKSANRTQEVRSKER